MSKVGADIKELQRCLGHLQQLDGRPLWAVDGLFLTWPSLVVDPGPLLSSCREHGGASLASVQASLTMTRSPVRVTTAWLARARRDLRRLNAGQGWVEQAWASSRTLAKFPRPDQAWLEGREARLGELQRPRLAAADGWFEAALELVGWLRGEVACEIARGMAQPPARSSWRTQRKWVERLAACLRTDCEPADVELRRPWQRLRRLRAQPAPRRILQILAGLLGQTCAHPPITHPSMTRWNLPDYVQRLGMAMLDGSRIAPQSSADAWHEQVAGWALLFEPDPEADLTGVPFTRARTVAGQGLGMAQALALLRLDVEPETQQGLVRHIRAGLSPESLPSLEPLKVGGVRALDRLARLPVDPARTRVWCAWVAALVPHFEAMQVPLDLPDHLFDRFASTHADELLLLAHCVFSLPVPQQLAWLESTVALFSRAPEHVPDLLDGLDGTDTGLGARLYPEFCAWLGDAGLLDRHLYLQRRAGLEARLTGQLLRDFERPQRLTREREWLRSLEAPTPLQSLRLSKLLRPERPADPAKTRERLRRQAEPLLGQIVQKRMDDVVRAVVRTLAGLTLPQVTQSWRDTIRFFLGSEINAHLSRLLISFAARQPGRPIERFLPANQAWLEEAKDRIDLDAWLGTGARSLRVGERTWSLALEGDPLEVLRMGVPFATCLSLVDGEQAASTLVNALDANKRVLYVRDERGAIRARKLLAISEDWSLLGYRLYQIEPDAQVEEAVLRFCQGLALPLASEGVPVQLHPGQWYDDGPEAFEAVCDVTGAYCEWLRRPLPPKPIPCLAQEARAWAAWQGGRLEEALEWAETLPLPTVFRAEVARWLGDRYLCRCAPEAVSHRPDLVELVKDLRRKSGWEEVSTLLSDWHTLWPSRELAEVVADALGDGDADSDWLESMAWSLPHDLRLTPVVRTLELIDRASPRIQSFMEWAYFDALVESYAAQPDPQGVVRYLSRSHAGAMGRRAAVAVVAFFPFPNDLRGPQPPWSALDDWRRAPIGCPKAVAALRLLAARVPTMASEPLLHAALLRQAEPGLKVDRVLAGLPPARSAPFEEVADLQLHPRTGLEEWLERWNAPADKWSPGPWELDYHRRHPGTPWRRSLESAARDGDQRAGAWLWRLDDRGDSVGQIYAALARLQAPFDDESLAADLRFLCASTLPPRWLPELLRRYCTEPSIDQESFIGALLARGRGGCDVWRAEIVTELWQQTQLRLWLGRQLATCFTWGAECAWGPAVHCLEATARRLQLPPVDRATLLSVLTEPALRGQEGFQDFEEVLSLVFQLKQPAHWVEELLDLSDAWSISHFLDGLRTRERSEVEELRRLAREHPRMKRGSLQSFWLDAD